jgi:hypothetical protein
MKIDRSALLNSLESFVQLGSGLVIGGPGAGKTYLVSQLSKRLEERNQPNLYVAVDALGDGTAAEIREGLELETDLIPALQREGIDEGILIIDGYDAARNERVQRNILQLIRRARQELTNWRIIAVVRTYDAQKSPELADLFPIDAGTTSGKTALGCRHFLIPALEPAEIESLNRDSPALLKAYAVASKDLKTLLAVPFNLWLLEKMLPGSAPEEFAHIGSQVQLLGLFWQRRVTGAPNGLRRKHVLAKVVDKMVSERSLSVPQAHVFEPTDQQEWQDLLSQEVLIEQYLGNKVRFGHNILFDYAVSVLMIGDEPREVVNFVRADPSRQLFLRPSFVFYFARLWHDSPDLFWATYKFLLGDDGIDGRLLGRLVPPTVLVQECNDRVSLEPLVEMQGSAPNVGPSAALYALRSLRTWQPRSVQPWTELVRDLAGILSANFAWEIGLFIEDTLKGPEPQVSVLGQAARALMNWIWAERQSRRDFADAMLGRFGVPLVARTFASAPEASLEALTPVLGLVNEADFPIQPLYQLTANLAQIAAVNPSFVGNVYRTLFGARESSEARTQMGSSTVLVFTSTRRQDFEMCHYALLEYFPKFLQVAFKAAVSAGIDGANVYVKTRHTPDGEREFAFRGGTAAYAADGSGVWDAHFDPYEPILVLEHVFSGLDAILAKSGCTPEIEEALYMFRDQAQVAFCWKRLLRLVAKHPGLLRDVGAELCAAPPILSGRDTLYEAGTALSALASLMTPLEMQAVERAILSLEPERLRKRLVSQIALSALVTPEAKRLRTELEQANQIVPNQPVAQFRTYSREYTTEDWLQDRGVDVEREPNKKIRELSAAVTSAIGTRGGPAADRDPDAAHVAGVALWQALQNVAEADEEVMVSAWLALAEYARFVLTGNPDAGQPSSLLAREILVACGRHFSPKPYPNADSEFKSAVWGSSPRTEAAQLLPLWYARTGDPAALELFMALVEDSVPEVRYLSACELWWLIERVPARFWSAINDRITKEANDVVLQGLLDSIRRVIHRNEEAGVEALSRLRDRARSGAAPRELVDVYSDTVMWLVIVRENRRAIEFLCEILDDPVTYSKAVNRAAFDAGAYIAGKRDKLAEERSAGQNAIRWLIRIVDAAQFGIQQLTETNADQGEESVLADLHRSIDTIVTRIWVAKLGIQPDVAKEFYGRAKPILTRVVEFASTPDVGVLAPSTAQHIMEILNGFIGIDPPGVLKMAWQITQRSPGYKFDALAIAEVVKLVEAILADHRNQMREPESLQHLLELLDIFAETGWSEALRLVWRLDEVFR